MLSAFSDHQRFKRSGVSIAIVEDEPVLRDEMAFQLQHMNFTVETFKNAPQFYRQLAVKRFSVVILDIGLEGEDGFSIARHLREHDKKLGIIFVTARSLREDRLEGLATGADHFLVKPIDIDELALIADRLGQRDLPVASSSTDHHAAPLVVGEWHIVENGILLLFPENIRVRLSLNEQQLLNVLLKNPGVLCEHGELFRAMSLLPEEHNKHRIEVILSRLRDKVRRETGRILPIHARRGLGYVLVIDR